MLGPAFAPVGAIFGLGAKFVMIMTKSVSFYLRTFLARETVAVAVVCAAEVGAVVVGWAVVVVVVVVESVLTASDGVYVDVVGVEGGSKSARHRRGC